MTIKKFMEKQARRKRRRAELRTQGVDPNKKSLFASELSPTSQYESLDARRQSIQASHVSLDVE